MRIRNIQGLVISLALRTVRSAALIAAFLFVAPAPAHAGTNIWTRLSGPNCGSHSTVSALSEACLAALSGPYGNGSVSATVVYIGAGGGAEIYRWTGTYCAAPLWEDMEPNCAGGISYEFSETCTSLGQQWLPALGGCGTPFDCGSYSGRRLGRFFSGTPMSGNVCTSDPTGESDRCQARVLSGGFCNAGECYGMVEFTGESCSAEPIIDGDGTLAPSPPMTNCITTGGLSTCFAQSDENCGTVNGDAVCLDRIPEGGCVSTASGGAVCVVGADGAPTESDGVTHATAVGGFSGGGGGGTGGVPREFEYFDRDRVLGSGSPVRTAGGAGTGPGTDGEGTGEGLGEEVFGEDPGPGEFAALPEGEGFAAATAGFFAAIGEVPIVAAVADVGAAIPEGECPTASFEVFDTEYTISPMCEQWPDIAGVISAVALFSWGLLGIRIVFSA